MKYCRTLNENETNPPMGAATLYCPLRIMYKGREDSLLILWAHAKKTAVTYRRQMGLAIKFTIPKLGINKLILQSLHHISI